MNNVEFIRKRYPVGTRVRLVKMNEEAHPVAPGTYGSITMIDDIGTLHMNWDNGSCLGLVVGVDEFITEDFCTTKLYRTPNWKVTDNKDLFFVSQGGYIITDAPINEASEEIMPAKDPNEFEIVENDTEKDYGYTEVSDVEGKYLVECYKNRLDVSENFEKGLDALYECRNYADDPAETVKEAIDQHLDWWCVKADIPENVPVFELTYDEITSLLQTGFAAQRVFIRRI